MRIKFPLQTNKKVIEAITAAMGGRGLADIVSLEDQGNDLVVKISKLGTSTLTFKRSEQGQHAEFNLSAEKIAFAHKAFKDEVKSKLISVITKAGGEVSEA